MVSQKITALKTLPLLLASIGIFASTHANAAITTDVRGNTAYDTAAECDAAVQNGTARFYVPEAKNKPLRQKGERSVKTSRISDLGDQYRLGACDVGVGKKNGRVGVDRKLQGKYVPFSPSMPLNTYLDASGNVVRVSMQGCDNRFSEALPRAVSIPAPPPVVIAPPPVPVIVAVEPPPLPAPAPMPPPMMVVAPPAPTPPPSPSARTNAYVFGLVAAQNDAICQVDGDKATLLVGQIGAGMNFNAIFGAEIYAQAAKDHSYNTAANNETSSTSAFGVRLTAGAQLTPHARIFAKAGAAYVNHQFGNDSKSEARPTLGVGITYDLTPALSLRGDADMSFKRSKNQPHPAWGDDKFVGLGLQYKF